MDGDTEEVYNECIIDVKTSAECIKFVKHISNKFISFANEPLNEISNVVTRIRILS